MEDRDGKKPFVIPKTHTSNKDVLIKEKSDSRNVTELFDDIKSCALESQFDFRQSACKSCDTIRNPKLQKLYNERRIKMKKEHDPIERFAFHLITYRGVAVNVANNGLTSEQLPCPIEKYLGNPKDGVHLSRRPDVLLTSSGVQGLYRFGLLVCKVLLGKGYATIASPNNNQLPAQLHYDHHFCKIQSMNKEQRHIDDLLGNSLIFCYEHENFEPISHPTQILPIAILWYDLTERFAPELMPASTQESQHRNGKITNGDKFAKKKTSIPRTKTEPIVPNKVSTSSSGSWEGPSPELNTNELSTTKYPSHFMAPYYRVYSTPSVPTSVNLETQQKPMQQIISSRDPRLLRTKRETPLISSETIPLSPQHLLNERSLSDGSITSKSVKLPSDEPILITKSTSVIYIPLNPSASLIDPRLKTLKPIRAIFYLQLQAVKHALQQQKRLNHYYDPKSGLPPKTSYTLVPFLTREVPNEEYERLLNDEQPANKLGKHSNTTDYSSLYISVVDCFNFGLTNPNQVCVDLEQHENRLAYEQIEISNELIEREKQLNSQQIRLHLREKRQRRMQQHMYDKPGSKSSLMSSLLPNSKSYMTTGRKVLKEHPILTDTPNTHLSPILLDFFSREYKTENRPQVKLLLAEMVGIFMEKYHVEHNQLNGEENPSAIQEPVTDNQTINDVIDMDLSSPSAEELRDHDERFRIPTPPPPPSEPAPSLTHNRALSNDPEFKGRCLKLVDQLREECRLRQLQSSNLQVTTKTDLVIPTEEAVFEAYLGQSESSSSENSPVDHNHPLVINEEFPSIDTIPLLSDQDDANRSRDEFVRLLTKEACISKSSSPAKKQDNHKHSYDYPKHRRRSHDDDEEKNHSSNTHQRYTRPSDRRSQPKKSFPKKKLSSNRTVLISKPSTIFNENPNTTDISTDNLDDSQEEPVFKRPKLDLSPTTTDNHDAIDEREQGRKSLVTTSVAIGDRDCRHDLNEKRRLSSTSSVSVAENTRTKSKDHHREKRRSSPNSHHSSRTDSKSNNYSRSSSSKDNQHRNRNTHEYERHHSPELSTRRHDQSSDRYDLFYESSYRNSLSSIYHERDTLSDLTLPGNIHTQRQSVRHMRYNYNHQSVANHPRFSNPDVLLSSTSLIDFDYSTSPPRHHSNSSIPIGDRSMKSSYYQSQSESNSRTYPTTSFDSKPSDTIEQLQMLLQTKTIDVFDQSKNP